VDNMNLHWFKKELSFPPLREKVRMRVFINDGLFGQFSLTPVLSQMERELTG